MTPNEHSKKDVVCVAAVLEARWLEPEWHVVQEPVDADTVQVVCRRGR